MTTKPPCLLIPLLVLALVGRSQGADAPQVIDLWPSTPPGVTTATGPEEDFAAPAGSVLPRQIKNVSIPPSPFSRRNQEKPTGSR